MTHEVQSSDLTYVDAIADAVAPHLEPEERRALVRERVELASDPLNELRRTRALAELLEISEERSVLRASDAGHTQRAIAEALGKPQTQVHRILRRAKLGETNMRTPVREVILQRWAGVITKGMMLGLLSEAEEGTSAHGEHDAGFAPDDWDEIRSAYMAALLTESEYEELRNTKARAGQRRRRR